MRTRSIVASLAAAHALSAAVALAQPNLPPPPPPPIGEPPFVPPPAPPRPAQPAPSQPPATSPAAAPPAAAPAPRRLAPAAPAQPAAAQHSARHRHPEVRIVEEAPARRRLSLAVTLNPLPLALGRLSGNVELSLAPHHSVVASPNLIFWQADRGGRYSFVSEGFGFATRTSASFGVELGYHYWWQARDSLRGPFAGPSLLLGSTTQASVGDASRSQGYWGAAFDVGGLGVLAGGFTIGGGLGLGLVHLADATAVFPRVLFFSGWMF
jgi:hypothetical protein